MQLSSQVSCNRLQLTTTEEIFSGIEETGGFLDYPKLRPFDFLKVWLNLSAPQDFGISSSTSLFIQKDLVLTQIWLLGFRTLDFHNMLQKPCIFHT